MQLFSGIAEATECSKRGDLLKSIAGGATEEEFGPSESRSLIGVALELPNNEGNLLLIKFLSSVRHWDS